MRNSRAEHEEAKVKKTTYLGAWLLFLSDIFQIILALLLIVFAVMAWHLTDDPFSIVRVLSGEL